MSKNFKAAINHFLSTKYGGNRSKMALALGFSPQLVASWAAGKTVPREENLARVAEALGYTADQLINGDDFASPDEADLRISEIEARLEKIEQKLLVEKKVDPLIGELARTFEGASEIQIQAVIALAKTLRGSN